MIISVALSQHPPAFYSGTFLGKLYIWGDGFTGRRGDGTTTSDSPQFGKPLPISALASYSIVSVTSGWNHLAALAADGSVFIWGDHGKGDGSGPGVLSTPFLVPKSGTPLVGEV